MKKIEPLFFCLISFIWVPTWAQGIFDHKITEAFATYLYEENNYAAAITEFNRAWMLNEISAKSQAMLFQSYFNNNQYYAGIKRYKTRYPDILSQNATLEFIFGKMLIASESTEAVNWLTGNSTSLTNEQISFLNFSNKLIKYESGNVLGALIKYEDENMPPSYKSILLQYENYENKNPVVSLALSVVIPGLGKVYSGYWKDGVTGFLSIALTGWQAYRGYSRYGASHPYTITYTIISASFYFGNLYGSFKSAKRYNYMLNKEINSQINAVFYQSDPF